MKLTTLNLWRVDIITHNSHMPRVTHVSDREFDPFCCEPVWQEMKSCAMEEAAAPETNNTPHAHTRKSLWAWLRHLNMAVPHNRTRENILLQSPVLFFQGKLYYVVQLFLRNVLEFLSVWIKKSVHQWVILRLSHDGNYKIKRLWIVI